MKTDWDRFQPAYRYGKAVILLTLVSLGILLVGCSSMEFSGINGPNVDQNNQDKIFAEDIQDNTAGEGDVVVGPLIDPQTSEGYSKQEIIDNLNAIIVGLQSDDMLGTCLDFFNLMEKLKTSPMDKEAAEKLKEAERLYEYCPELSPVSTIITVYDSYGRVLSYEEHSSVDGIGSGVLFEVLLYSDELIYLEEHSLNETSPSAPKLIDNKCYFKASKNVNCRQSDHVESTILAILLQGEDAELLAFNLPFTHGQFELSNQEKCWIFFTLMEGPNDPVKICRFPVINAPLPVIKPVENKPKAKVCSNDLGQSACVAAGGTWVDGGITSAPYCVCK